MVVQIQAVTASFWVRHGSLTEVAVLMHVPPLSNEDVILRPQRARFPTRAETSIAWQWYRGPRDVPSLGEIRLPGKGGSRVRSCGNTKKRTREHTNAVVESRQMGGRFTVCSSLPDMRSHLSNSNGSLHSVGSNKGGRCLTKHQGLHPCDG
jgi:hypothetical protein